MRKGFRPSLEPTADRRVHVDGSRRTFCAFTTTLVLVLVFGIFGVCGWSVYSHQFSKSRHHFHSGDQVALLSVADDLNSVFCDSYQVTLLDHDRAWFLPHRAHINQSHTTNSSFSIQRVSDGHYSSVQSYLLQGSSLEVGACRHNGSAPERLHLLVIKGKSDFNTWKLDPHCTTCIFQHATTVPSAVCSEVEPQTIYLNVSFPSTGFYAFIVHFGETADKVDLGEENHRPRDTAGVTVTGTFQKTRYETKDSEKQCGGRQTCTFDLPWGSTNDIVVDLGGSSIGMRAFMTKCGIRYGFWIPVFGGVPILLAVPIMATFAWFLCRSSKEPDLQRLTREVKKKRSKSKAAARAKTERDDAGLVPNEVVQQEDDGSMTIQDG